MRSTSKPRDEGFDLGRLMNRLANTSRVPSRKPSLIVDNTVSADMKASLAKIEANETEPRSDVWPLPGFAPMTRIATSFGDVHAIALRKGDLIRTARGEIKPIVWLDRVILDDRFLNDMPDANPVKITADAFGRGLPKVDVMMSPRQVIGLNSRLTVDEGTEASDLLSRPGIFRMPETGLSYTMFHLGEPADVLCEGIAVRVNP